MREQRAAAHSSNTHVDLRLGNARKSLAVSFARLGPTRMRRRGMRFGWRGWRTGPLPVLRPERSLRQAPVSNVFAPEDPIPVAAWTAALAPAGCQ